MEESRKYASLGGDFGILAQEVASKNLNRSEILSNYKPKKVKKSKIVIQLAYLFASPLVLQTSERNRIYDGLPAINFKEEYEEIFDTMVKSKLKFRVRYQMATEANLKECLNHQPIGLHFSGHGFQKTASSFAKDPEGWRKNQQKGDFLLFEQPNGASINMYETDLKQILDTYKPNLPHFVVVNSCHSEQCGKIFANAGVEHVICVN